MEIGDEAMSVEMSILKKIRAVHIKTARESQLREALEDLFEMDETGRLTAEPIRFTDGTETHGVAFIEGSGGGKTTAIRRALNAFEPLALNVDTGAPHWLFVKVESPATLRSLGVDILKKLGIDRVADRTKVYDVWDMVRKRLQIMDIKLLWIDEAHDLFSENITAETNAMFRMLKGLMQGDHPVVVVLSGTDRLKRITKMDGQINRRFAKICPPALAFGADNEGLEKIVHAYARKAGLKPDISPETVNRIIRAGRHRFGRCIELIILAISCALKDKSKSLNLQHFEVAYGKHESCEITENVFAVPDWTSIVLGDDDAAEAMNDAKPKRGRKNKAA